MGYGLCVAVFGHNELGAWQRAPYYFSFFEEAMILFERRVTYTVAPFLSMTCYSPLKGYKKPGGGITFSPSQGFRASEIGFMQVPCGQCVGCRLERSRQWAVRCAHEASLYERNCMLNLTYNDANLPSDGSLDYRHFQLFMKRLRKRYGAKIRFYMCGEYGDTTHRPHYHALLFNFDFDDKSYWRKSPTGYKLYWSKQLEELWTYGNSEIGAVFSERGLYRALCDEEADG